MTEGDQYSPGWGEEKKLINDKQKQQNFLQLKRL
jgi:hypothetical protein